MSLSGTQMDLDQQRDASRVPRTVAQVTAITITGQPRLFVLDAAAIWSGDEALAAAILRQLALLAEYEAIRVVVVGVDDEQRAQLSAQLPATRLVIDTRSGPADVPALLAEHRAAPHDCLAILARAGASVPEGCLAFFVGAGAAPDHAHPTRERTPAATNAVLALYGTALGQERAGIAFREASQGRGIPDKMDFNGDILIGVIRSVAEPARPLPAPRRALPDAAALRVLAARAYDHLLRNILPDGAVVASPAHGQAPGEPNYWFFWQRDSAAVMSHLIAWHARAPLGLPTEPLDPTIARYARFIRRTQAHGDLGTSRYGVDGEPILGYGNPQLDGPAMSALALARVQDSLDADTAFQAYLDFLRSPDGQDGTMDAWEFIYGRLYNAEYLRHIALLAGAARAERSGRTDDEATREQVERARQALRAFEDARTGRLVSALETYNPWFTSISRLDTAAIAALLAGWWARHDGVLPDAATPATRLGEQPGSLAAPSALATLAALEDVFQPLYRVNREWLAGGNEGWGLGRFPEDANDGVGSTGGNPWSLSTLWAAQYYYALALELARHVEVTPTGLALPDRRQIAFMERATDGAHEDLQRTIAPATWRTRILPELVRRGDGYLNFVVHHMPEDGAITEQIDRETGQPRGAPALSWALAELIAAIALREEALPLATPLQP